MAARARNTNLRPRQFLRVPTVLTIQRQYFKEAKGLNRPLPAPVAHECDLRRMVMNEDSMSKIHRRYSRLARAVIAMIVFAVGMLSVQAWQRY